MRKNNGTVNIWKQRSFNEDREKAIFCNLKEGFCITFLELRR